MDVDELRALLAVSDAGSMQGAARELGWPRATLRRRIDSLEAETGAELFHRDGRGANLTDAGHQMLERARRIIREVDSLLEDARSPSAGPSGRLRIVAPVGLPAFLFGQLMDAAVNLYPRIEWDLRFVADPLATSRMATDLMLNFGPRMPSSDWVSVRVVRAPCRLLASPHYLKHHGTPTTVAELQQHRLLSWRSAEQREDIWQSREGDAFQVRPTVSSNNIHFLRRAARAGAGIAFLPDGYGVDPDWPPDALVTVMENEVVGSREGFLSVPESLQDLEPMRTILSMIRTLAVE